MARVLLVDDNERNLRFLRDGLEAHGYTVATAASGPEALESAGTLNPDVILVDVQMPGMSGTETMKRFKASGALDHVPILAVTALAMKGDEAQLLEAGFDGYLSKPVTLAEMLRALHEVLGDNRQAGES
ncbi:MAG TPA: response regulator [Trueperaceae bacterium]